MELKHYGVLGMKWGVRKQYKLQGKLNKNKADLSEAMKKYKLQKRNSQSIKETMDTTKKAYLDATNRYKNLPFKERLKRSGEHMMLQDAYYSFDEKALGAYSKSKFKEWSYSNKVKRLTKKGQKYVDKLMNMKG